MTKERRWVYIKKSVKDGGHYTHKEKMEAVANYLATGNYALTARMMNISEPTIQRWKNQEWWKDAIRDIQIQEKVATSKSLAKIRDKALNVVFDRLENGNYQYDQKTGQIVQVPINARDAHRIATDFIDKEELLQARIHALGTQEDAKTSGNIEKLANAFIQVAKELEKKKKEADIIDAEFTEVNENG